MGKRGSFHLFRRRKAFFTSSYKKGPAASFKSALFMSFIIFSIATLIGFAIVQWGIRPSLLEIAKAETERMTAIAINDALSSKVLEDFNPENLLKYEYDHRGRIQAVSWNTRIYHDLQYATVKGVDRYLHDLEYGSVKDDQPSPYRAKEEGGILYMIPLGKITNNTKLALLGPKVPVRFSIIGDVRADVATSIVETGINNTYIEIALVVEVDLRVLMPFASDTTVVSTSIPIANFFHTGEIPLEYREGTSKDRPTTLKPPSNILESQLDLDDIINKQK